MLSYPIDSLTLSALIDNLLENKDITVVSKGQKPLIEATNIKNIISPHEGGYILIKWS